MMPERRTEPVAQTGAMTDKTIPALMGKVDELFAAAELISRRACTIGREKAAVPEGSRQV